MFFQLAMGFEHDVALSKRLSALFCSYSYEWEEYFEVSVSTLVLSPNGSISGENRIDALTWFN